MAEKGVGDAASTGGGADVGAEPSTPTRAVRPIVLPDPAPAPAGMDEEGRALWTKLARFDQQQLLCFWEELSADQKAVLKDDIDSVDLEQLARWFTRTQDSPVVKGHVGLKPISDDLVAESSALEPTPEMTSWEQTGLAAVAEGKLAVLLMAGGQGTRLGSSSPKGMYPLGLDSNATLFELQALRILRLEDLAFKQTGKRAVVPWYIMTSSGTQPATLQFFKDNNYWGLKPENVILFQQNEIPSLLENGKMLLAAKNRVVRAPDGNGGLYSSAVRANAVDDMEKRGIGYVHIYGVDNILVKVGDPRFLGYCIETGVDVGAKCVKKEDPAEKVGLVCLSGDKYEVMEYSEITPAAMELRRPDGGLVYNAGSICNHLYTMAFMKDACAREDTLKHHVARKKLPHVNQKGEQVKPETPNGIKLEKFVFDVFRLAESLAVINVTREQEFSPLKNADGAGNSCVETCRASLYALHRDYLAAAGVTFVDADGKPIERSALDESHRCEISPLVSYMGEGLADIAKANPTMTFPILLKP